MRPAGQRPNDGAGSLATAIRWIRPVRETVQICVAVAAAVAERHAGPGPHGSLTPHAIRLSGGPGFPVPVTALVRSSVAGRPSDGEVLAYRAPERFLDPDAAPDERSDLYSLGALLFAVATGRPPFTADDALGWRHAHLAVAPPALRTVRPDVPDRLAATVDRLLAKQPAERYHRATDVVAELRRCLEEVAGTAVGGLAAQYPIAAFGGPPLPSGQLYGRDTERGQLRAALEEAGRSGRPLLVTVSGSPGMGKSALAADLARAVRERSGFVGLGKFEKGYADVPYASLPALIATVVDDVLTGPADRDRAASAVLDALGPLAGLATAAAPALERLVGPQSAPGGGGAVDAKRRFQQAMRHLIDGFTYAAQSEEIGLVLVVDDLQWADAASLGLVEQLVAEPGIPGLAMVLAHREGPRAQEAADAVAAAAAAPDTVIVRLALRPLDPDAVAELVADALGRPVADVMDVAELVHGWAGGNPLDAIRVLGDLAAEGALRYDAARGGWNWDLRRYAATPPVPAQLPARHLRGLPRNSRRVLEVASCVRGDAPLSVVARVAGLSPEEALAALAPAVEANLVMTDGESVRFTHDTVRDMVYLLPSRQQRSAIQLGLARALKEHVGPQLGQHVFDVVEQFTATGHVPRDPAQRRDEVRLYLEAARTAQASGAFTAAARYLDEGLRRLRAADWRSARELAVAVRLARAEVAYSLHDMPYALRLAEQARRYARTPAERVAAAEIIANVNFTQGRVAEAAAAGVEVAAAQGLPIKLHPGEQAAADAYRAVHERFAGMSVDDVLNLPVCEDDEVRATMRALHTLTTTPLYDTDLWIVATATMTVLTLRHGLTPESALGLATLADAVCGRFQQYTEGRRMAEAALRLTDRPLCAADRPLVEVTLAMVVRWTGPPGESLPHLVAAHDLALVAGDPAAASYGVCWQINVLLDMDRPLDEVAGRIEEAIRYVDRVGYPAMSEFLYSTRWFVARLRDEHRPAADGRDAQADAIAGRLTQLPFILHKLEVLRLRLLTVEGDDEAALAAAERATALDMMELGFVESAEIVFFRALLAARLAERAPAGEIAQIERLRAALGRVRGWAETGREFFGCRAALLAAELACLDGDELRAIGDYENALQLATETKQLMMQGLIAEAAARCHAAAGRQTLAEAYLDRARSAYAQWGAVRKMRLIDAARGSAPVEPGVEERAGTLALAQAAQAISGTVEMDELVQQLTRTVLRQSGGDYAALLIATDERLSLAAEATVSASHGGVAVRTYPPGTAAEAASLPHGVLTQVVTSHDLVQLDGEAAIAAARHGARAGRPLPKSVLCVPMLRRGALAGVLYVENRLLSHAFPARRRGVLELLASQAAISIEIAQTRTRLQASEERYRALLEAAPDAILTTDRHGTVILVNSQTEDLFGYSREELLGRPISSLLTVEPEEAEPGGSPIRREGIRRDGDRFPVETTSSAMSSGAGQLETTIVRDVSERQRFEEQLQYLADHDTVTGLYNRRRLESELQQEVERAQRYGSEAALLVLDLDNFKDVNDVGGHHAGDEVLRAVAAVLRDRTRATDVIARLGGDEFALVLPETSADDAQTLAEGLLRAVSGVRVPVAEQHASVTASIGVAGLRDVGGTAQDVLAAADMALYDAKETGRDRVAVYDVRRLSATRNRVTWVDQLRQALAAGDGLLLYQQPILDLRSDAVTRCELLVRMRVQDSPSVIMPSTFLPVAERAGLITRVDRWVLGTAMQLISASRLGDAAVSVNLSAASLADPTLPEHVAGLLARHPDVDPRRLSFEVTETSVIANMEEAAALSRQLRDLGCGLALDDFGAGFGSFYYLKHLPLDVVKLDGDFVRALRHSAVDRSVIEAMVTIAGGLGLRTVAEYVPDEETCRWLAGHGVDYAQGFWIGPPADVALGPPRRIAR